MPKRKPTAGYIVPNVERPREPMQRIEGLILRAVGAEKMYNVIDISANIRN